MLIGIKMKAELGHNGPLEIYVGLKRIYVHPGILVHFSKMARYIWLIFCMEY